MNATRTARGLTLAEVVDAGDHVLVRLDAATPGTTSLYQVYRFAGGKVIRIDDFRRRDKAMRAAGLSS